jgi:hypothetical protein
MDDKIKTDDIGRSLDDLAIRLLGHAIDGCDLPMDVRSDMILAVSCLLALAQSSPDAAVFSATWPAVTVTMSAGEAARLADRLTCEKTSGVDHALAGRLIAAMLRAVHSSDCWTLPPPANRPLSS